MNRIKSLLAIVLAALLLYSYGQQPYRLESVLTDKQILEALSELEALQAPEGVDGRVFQELKSALADAEGIPPAKR